MRVSFLYIGTAKNAAGMKQVNSARFITVRPPRTLLRPITNAAEVATNSVMAATATATATAISTEFQSCSQKWSR